MILENTYPPEKQLPVPSAAEEQSGPSPGGSSIPWPCDTQDVSNLPPPPAYSDLVGVPTSSSSFQPQFNPQPSIQQLNTAFNAQAYPPPGQGVGYMNLPPDVNVQRSASWSPMPSGHNQMPVRTDISPQTPQPQPSSSEYFAPFSILSLDTNLAHGFPGSNPSSRDKPHPFSTHDVKKEDWMQFLGEVQQAGRATPKEQIISGLTSTVGRLPIAGGLLALGLEVTNANCKKSSPIGQTISRWNEKYFHPRMIDIVLARGRTCYTGNTKAIPADMQPHHRGGNSNHDSWSTDEDDSDSSDGDREHHGRSEVGRPGAGGLLHEVRTSRQALQREFGMDLSGRKAIREERQEHKARRKAERRERKVVRREAKRAHLVENDDRWRLVVSFKPRVLV